MGPAAILREIKSFVANVFARETLGEPTRVEGEARPRRQIAAMLFRREPLALEAAPPPTSPPRPGLLRALFLPEALPEDPPAPPATARPGLLRALFAPEPLPELPATPERPRRAAWLRWLFRFERLDPP
jgi:hypothetical protein